MKNLMDYIPKKYRPYITDFYKDSEDNSYWLELDCEGKYYLEYYYADSVIHEDTISAVLEVLRTCIKEKTETK